MKVFPSYVYKDPAIVLEQKQQRAINRSCFGCVHSIKMIIAGTETMVCDKGKKHGRKCKLFKK